jgi:hypothetical protein
MMRDLDYEDGWTNRNVVISEGLPAYLSEIYSRWDYRTGYLFTFYGANRVLGYITHPMKYKGRRPCGYFGEIRVAELTPEQIISRFPRVMKRFRGNWLGKLLKLEIGKSDGSYTVNPQANAAYFAIPEDERKRIKKIAATLAGNEGYLNNESAIAFIAKELLDRGVPIKSPELIKEVMLGIGGRKL